MDMICKDKTRFGVLGGVFIISSNFVFADNAAKQFQDGLANTGENAGYSIGDRMLGFARFAKYFNTTTISYDQERFIEDLMEGKPNHTFSLMDIMEEVRKVEDRRGDDFWNERADNIENLIRTVTAQELVNALNTEYGMKDLRKDLREITKSLKNHSSK